MKSGLHRDGLIFFWLTSTLLHRYKFGNGIPGCTTLAPPRGIFCSSSGPLHIFHWNHRARGEGPRPRSQGRFGIAGIRTRTGSGVCSVVTNCATPARTLLLFSLSPLQYISSSPSEIPYARQHTSRNEWATRGAKSMVFKL